MAKKLVWQKLTTFSTHRFFFFEIDSRKTKRKRVFCVCHKFQRERKELTDLKVFRPSASICCCQCQGLGFSLLLLQSWSSVKKEEEIFIFRESLYRSLYWHLIERENQDFVFGMLLVVHTFPSLNSFLTFARKLIFSHNDAISHFPLARSCIRELP